MGEAKRREARIAKPVPSLAAYLGERRADGFVDWCERMMAADDSMLKADASSTAQILIRLLRVQMVAAVESLRVEDEAGRDHVEMITHLPRAMGIVAMNALACILKDDADVRDFAVTITEEFRFAAKEVADQIMRASDNG